MDEIATRQRREAARLPPFFRRPESLFGVLLQVVKGHDADLRHYVDEDADRYGWENRIRLKGVDVSVYAYQLYRALALLAERGGTDPARWRGDGFRGAR